MQEFPMGWESNLSRAPPIACEIVCRPKKQGGFGIHDSHIWNLAAIGKQVWQIASNQESLWLQWIKHVYIKGRSWKRYKCPSSASWTWK